MADCIGSVVFDELPAYSYHAGRIFCFGVLDLSTESSFLLGFLSSLKEQSLFCQIQQYDHVL